MEKVYTELQETKKEVKQNSHHIVKLETVFEQEIKPDIKTLYELQVQTNKKLEEHNRRFDSLEAKADALGRCYNSG